MGWIGGVDLSREYKILKLFFADYHGYLHCNGYQAYDQLAGVNLHITLVGCLYHARRKFADTEKMRKNDKIILKMIVLKSAANIFSLVETCKVHGVNPYNWLREVLGKIPYCETVEEYEALWPFNIKKTAVDQVGG